MLVCQPLPSREIVIVIVMWGGEILLEELSAFSLLLKEEAHPL